MQIVRRCIVINHFIVIDKIVLTLLLYKNSHRKIVPYSHHFDLERV